MHFDSFQKIIQEAVAEKQTISEMSLTQSALDLEKPRQEIYNQMLASWEVMKAAVAEGNQKDLKSMSGLTGGMAYKVKYYQESGKSIAGDFMSEVLSSALAVAEFNACMGRIVAAPTAGSCGILPACLITLRKRFDIPEEKIVMGLFNASALGMVIAKNASISGAEGGCQAECGSAAAMAASAMVEIMGGSPEMCGHAAALALKSLMGLICDPVAGLVEEPCVIRNASSAAIAVTSAEMALAGVESLIPVDEVIDAMGIVGRMLPPCFRETADGGVAACPTGRRIKQELSY